MADAGFPSMLRSLRESAGLTQAALGERAGLSLHAVRHYEQGNREPGYSALLGLARALGVGLGAFDPGDGAGVPPRRESKAVKAVGRSAGRRGRPTASRQP